MSNVLTNTNLVAREKTLDAAGIAITLVMRVPAPLKSIAMCFHRILPALSLKTATDAASGRCL